MIRVFLSFIAGIALAKFINKENMSDFTEKTMKGTEDFRRSTEDTVEKLKTAFRKSTGAFRDEFARKREENNA